VFNNERPHEGLNNQVPASLYIPSSIRLPRKLPEFMYPKGLLLRRVNNRGNISWHRNRVSISEAFRFEELGVELITRGFTESSFETWRPENSVPKSFASELREEWSEPVEECIGLEAATEIPVTGGSLNPGRLMRTDLINDSLDLRPFRHESFLVGGCW
jgi:hypothetical protein